MTRKELIKIYEMYKLFNHKFGFTVMPVNCYRHKEEMRTYLSFDECLEYLLGKRKTVGLYDEENHWYQADIIEFADIENRQTMSLPKIFGWKWKKTKDGKWHWVKRRRYEKK